MEAAMGEHQTDAGPMDAVRMHLEAIRTEAARIEPKVLLVAVLNARERLAHRPEPLPERIAARDSRITAKLKELEARELKSAADSLCNVHLTIDEAAYDLANEHTDFDDVLLFWHDLAESAVSAYIECELGI
jgi:hypothetical protein